MRLETVVYKTVGELAIRADVYRPDDDGVRPVIVYIHGGALIMGQRGWIDPAHLESYVADGFAVVSIDYRLAPETRLPAIAADVEDAFAWVGGEGARRFGFDPDRQPEAFTPYCPVQNVTPEYPPTLLLHGDHDTDVPYEQSAMMAAALQRAGVEHELVTIAGGGHGFDGEHDDPNVAAAFERVRAFLKRNVGKSRPESCADPADVPLRQIPRTR